MNVPVYIPSRGRAGSLHKRSLAVFPDATVVVAEDERQDYLKVVPAEKLLCHPGVQGLSAIRNWIFDHTDAPVHVQADDDISVLVFRGVGWTRRRWSDPEAIRTVLEVTAQCAVDVGAHVFGFSQQPNPIHYKPMTPFVLNQWVGGVVGYVAGHGLRYDELMPLHTDIDFCLQTLAKHRIIWMDSRWSFVQERLTNAGGLNAYRTAAVYEHAHKRLASKWGQYVEVSGKTWDYRRRRAGRTDAKTLLTKVRVKRKQLGGQGLSES